MKKVVILAIIAMAFTSCGKKYNYKCTTQGNQSSGITTPDYFGSMTEREARRYERKHSANDDGNDQLIGPNEIQCTCTKL